MDQYDYLVAIDFQVTSGGEITEKALQEVIEFPWVVIDVASKQTVDERQVFVKPVTYPELTEECTAESGITNVAIEGAPTLQGTMQEFNDYLYRSFIANNKDFCLIVDGEVQLKRWLRADCKRKGIKLAAHYSKFIDLRTEFRQQYPKWAGASTVPAMLDRLEVQQELTFRGGIQYCRAMAAIVTRILEDGGRVHKTITIPDDYDPLEDPVYQPGGPKHVDRERQLPSEIKKGTSIVKLRGMPYTASEQDVIDFFKGCNVVENGVLICKNHQGRPSGEAFVQFTSPEDGAKGLLRDRDLMIRRYVEVFASTQQDMDNSRKQIEASANSTGAGGDPTYRGVIKMRGLPFSVTMDDIRAFFKDLPIKTDGIVLCESRDGRQNGESFVEFVKESYAEEAKKYDRQTLGSRYVEIFPSSKADVQNYFSRNAYQHNAGRGAAPGGGAPGEYFIKMRGLPFTARERDVMEFFGRAGLTPIGVSLVYNSRDQPNGEAFIEFANAEDMQRGMGLNKDTMGHRYVELFRSTRADAMQALGLPSFQVPSFGGMPMMGGDMGFNPRMMEQMMSSFGGGNMPDFAAMASMFAGGGADLAQMGGGGGGRGGGHGGGNSFGGGGSAGVKSGPSTVKMRGLPFRATTNDIMDFFRGYQFVPELVTLNFSQDGRPNGEAFVTFISPDEATRAMAERNRQHMGNRYVEIFPTMQ